MEALYPNIEVSLIGEDGNAFAILSRVRAALRRGKVPANEITKFHDEATSGDYDHLLRTCLKYVTVDRDHDDEEEEDWDDNDNDNDNEDNNKE